MKRREEKKRTFEYNSNNRSQVGLFLSLKSSAREYAQAEKQHKRNDSDKKTVKRHIIDKWIQL